MREDKITSSADRQTELPETQIKEASLYLMELDKTKTQALKTGSWDGIMIVNRVMIRELKWCIRRIGDNQPESLIRRTITCELTTDASPQATSFRANLQEDARSGSLDTFRQHNSSLRYWDMESEGIPDRRNKTNILLGEKTQATNNNNLHPRKTELNDRFTFKTMQVRRLHFEGRNNINDLQNMELYATGGHIRDTIQQTNQQLCNSKSQRSGTHFHNAFNYKWSKVKLYFHSPIPVLNRVLQKMKQDKAQGIIIAPILPGQSWYTKLKNLFIKFLFLGQADKIL
ncbi:MAG: hypothetical protein EZS28_029474, partial [Streblomastix strix]